VGVGVTQFLDGLQSHNLDNEWSSILAYAPTPQPNEYNSDPNAYLAQSYRLAAHEDTALDQTAYYFYNPGVGINNHAVVALSLAKHASYAFNPDNNPLIPGSIIAAVNAAIVSLYDFGEISYEDFLYYDYIANVTFYSCVVEHFNDQGGGLASSFTNVGELSNPVNGSHYILDTEPSLGLQPKLSKTLWVIQ